MQMKTGFFAALALLACVIQWGCTVYPTMTVNDKTYYVLTPAEERQLVRDARRLLIKPSKAISREEVALIQSTEPRLDVTYTADRTGKAKVIWIAPGKAITITYAGQFFSDDMVWSLETEKLIPDNTLKFLPPQMK